MTATLALRVTYQSRGPRPRVVAATHLIDPPQQLTAADPWELVESGRHLAGWGGNAVVRWGGDYYLATVEG